MIWNWWRDHTTPYGERGLPPRLRAHPPTPPLAARTHPLPHTTPQNNTHTQGADAAAEHAPPPAVNANASVTEQEAAVLDELDAEVAREMEAPRPRHERLAVLVDIEVCALVFVVFVLFVRVFVGVCCLEVGGGWGY